MDNVKTERFELIMTAEEKAALRRLARRERLPMAAVVRRLVWTADRQAREQRQPRQFAGV